MTVWNTCKIPGILCHSLNYLITRGASNGKDRESCPTLPFPSISKIPCRIIRGRHVRGIVRQIEDKGSQTVIGGTLKESKGTVGRYPRSHSDPCPESVILWQLGVASCVEGNIVVDSILTIGGVLNFGQIQKTADIIAGLRISGRENCNAIRKVDSEGNGGLLVLLDGWR
jgi:hypothetical protein